MAHSTLGRSASFQGEISGTGSVSVMGTVSGTISVDGDVSVPRNAVAEAAITATNVEVGGRVKGDIRARDRVEVFSEGTVEGDIRAPRILIANGAVFRGNVAP